MGPFSKIDKARVAQAFGRGVQATADLARIQDLPRRDWRTLAVASELTELLRTPQGTMQLRPIQAAALQELHDRGGLFAPIMVGGGKTLISYLAATAADAERPLLLVPAALVGKTQAEFAKLRNHWQTDVEPKILSYELLSRDRGRAMLEDYRPDLIIADECHRLKNRKAARTKRVSRHMDAHRGTKFVGMSGTITSRGLEDYAHLLRWALGEMDMPLPRRWRELQDWAAAVDVKTEIRLRPGALTRLDTQNEYDPNEPLGTIRKVVRRRLVETPGVISSDGDRPPMSLNIEKHFLVKHNDDTKSLLDEVRNSWSIPTPHYRLELSSPVEFWRACRTIGQGFYYFWNPEPPLEWLKPRQTWARQCRYILRHNRRQLDTEMQVANAVTRGEFDGVRLMMEAESVERAYSAWLDVKDTFKPNPVPGWFDTTCASHVEEMARKLGECIVWVEHTAFGAVLAEMTGWPFFQNQGLCNGQAIEQYNPADGPVIASIFSNAEGRNLQAWSKNIVVGVYPNGKTWEQMLGRTHRAGQQAEEVLFQVVYTCAEDLTSWGQALDDARYIASGMQEQKLLYGSHYRVNNPKGLRYT